MAATTSKRRRSPRASARGDRDPRSVWAGLIGGIDLGRLIVLDYRGIEKTLCPRTCAKRKTKRAEAERGSVPASEPQPSTASRFESDIEPHGRSRGLRLQSGRDYRSPLPTDQGGFSKSRMPISRLFSEGYGVGSAPRSTPTPMLRLYSKQASEGHACACPSNRLHARL